MAFSVASCLRLSRGDVLFNVMLGHRKLYGLTRTRQRFRRLEVGNRLSRSLTALALFAITRKIGVAIDLVHLHVCLAHTLTRFVDDLVQTLPMQHTQVRAIAPAAARSSPLAEAQQTVHLSSQTLLSKSARAIVEPKTTSPIITIRRPPSA